MSYRDPVKQAAYQRQWNKRKREKLRAVKAAVWAPPTTAAPHAAAPVGREPVLPYQDEPVLHAGETYTTLESNFQIFKDAFGNDVKVPRGTLIDMHPEVRFKYPAVPFEIPKVHPIRFAQGRYYYPQAAGTHQADSGWGGGENTGKQNLVDNREFQIKYLRHTP